MTDAQRKAIAYIVRLASDMYAATMDNKPIWDNREHMREYIGQFVDARLVGLNDPSVLAETVFAANGGER